MVWSVWAAEGRCLSLDILFTVLRSISMLPGGEGVSTGVQNRRDINNVESVLLSLNVVQTFMCSFYQPAGLQNTMV